MSDDWVASAHTLQKATIDAIKRFAQEHPSTEVCCFFFDCDEPRYGRVSIGLDTPENNIRSSKDLERFAIDKRQKRLAGKLAWQSAKYWLTTPILSPFNTNSGDFEFPQFAEIEFPSWVKLAEEGNYPKSAKHEDDYLESNARLVMWRVAEQLVAEDAFASLNLASPFLLGYSIHDQEEVILRLLNWPAGA